MAAQQKITVDVSEHYLARVHDIIANIPGAHSFAVGFTPEPDGVYTITASVVVENRPYPGAEKTTTTYTGTAVRADGEPFRDAVTKACVDMIEQITGQSHG
jgi:hypothetical protein